MLIAAGSTGCRPGAPPPPSAGTLRIALRADVTGFFPGPPLFNESFTLHVNQSVYESLVRFDGELRLRPALAERWSNPDDRTYRFHLRQGVRFSDGTPLTAADVVASLEAAQKSTLSSYLHAIESVRVAGEDEVEIRTRFPYLTLLTRLPWGFVIPHTAVERGLSPTPGTGPYRVESWDPGRGYVFVRNPRFHREPPAFARVVHTVVPDDTARMALVERGEADAADHVPLDQVDRLSRSPAVRVVSGAGLRVLLGWACESGDAGDVLGALTHSATGGPLGRSNSLGLADPALDGMIEAADRARTDRERARRLRLAVARVAELRAALPLLVQTEAVVLSRRLVWDAPLNMALAPEDLHRAP